MSVKSSHSQEYEVTGEIAAVETIDLLALTPPTLDGMTKALFVDVITRLAHLEEEGRQKDEKIAALETLLAEHEDYDAREHADDRRRIAALETPAPAIGQQTGEDHIDRLFSEMRRLKMRYITIKDAARLLDISKPHMHKLKPYLVDDSRFTIIKDPHHGQRYLIGII
jgi:hypothetical protein